MNKKVIKSVLNAFWSIIAGMNMPNASQSETPETLTGEVKFDLVLQEGNENERKD